MIIFYLSTLDISIFQPNIQVKYEHMSFIFFTRNSFVVTYINFEFGFEKFTRKYCTPWIFVYFFGEKLSLEKFIYEYDITYSVADL